MISSAKNYTKKKKKWTDRTLGQMVKGKLYRQNHTKKHTCKHSQKEKKEKIYIYTFWEVWGLLPAFSRCSVRVVPHVDVFWCIRGEAGDLHVLLLCHLEGLSPFTHFCVTELFWLLSSNSLYSLFSIASSSQPLSLRLYLQFSVLFTIFISLKSSFTIIYSALTSHLICPKPKWGSFPFNN